MVWLDLRLHTYTPTPTTLMLSKSHHFFLNLSVGVRFQRILSDQVVGERAATCRIMSECKRTLPEQVTHTELHWSYSHVIACTRLTASWMWQSSMEMLLLLILDSRRTTCPVGGGALFTSMNVSQWHMKPKWPHSRIKIPKPFADLLAIFRICRAHRACPLEFSLSL